jgi:hypothetical protein
LGLFPKARSAYPTQGTYRIFEQQWKEVILLWLGQEKIAKDKKEECIDALIKFKMVVKIFISRMETRAFMSREDIFLQQPG